MLGLLVIECIVGHFYVCSLDRHQFHVHSTALLIYMYILYVCFISKYPISWFISCYLCRIDLYVSQIVLQYALDSKSLPFCQVQHNPAQLRWSLLSKSNHTIFWANWVSLFYARHKHPNSTRKLHQFPQIHEHPNIASTSEHCINTWISHKNPNITSTLNYCIST